MTNVVDFKKAKSQTLRKKGKEKTLCGSGFHKWEVVTKNQFDVKSGKLVTAYTCRRCGATKSKAH